MLLIFKRKNVYVDYMARVWYSMCGCHSLLPARGEKTLNEIMASDAVSDFHKYPFYHELMRQNTNLVIMDTLITSKEDKCLPPHEIPKFQEQVFNQFIALMFLDKCRQSKIWSIIAYIPKHP
jgi:hypothetical protein